MKRLGKLLTFQIMLIEFKNFKIKPFYDVAFACVSGENLVNTTWLPWFLLFLIHYHSDCDD